MTIMKKKKIDGGKEVEKRELWYTVGGKVNYYSQYRKQNGSFPKKVTIELPYDPVIPLLSIYAKELKTQFQNSISMFTAACMDSTWHDYSHFELQLLWLPQSNPSQVFLHTFQANYKYTKSLEWYLELYNQTLALGMCLLLRY
jgi:hypothetical protein